MNIKTPPMTALRVPRLLKHAATLPASGRLAVSVNNLLYLDIDDAYIHDLFPLLPQQHQVRKPDYFKESGVGAHISVVYPEEHWHHFEEDLGKTFTFTVKEAVIADIDTASYYVLLVDAPVLAAIRQKYKLPPSLNFKNYWIGFHITIARG